MIALCRDAGATIASEVLDTGGPGYAMVRSEAFQLAMQTEGSGRFVPLALAFLTSGLLTFRQVTCQ